MSDPRAVTMTLSCEHGHLARSCEICELIAELKDARARIGELEAERDRYRKELEACLAQADAVPAAMAGPSISHDRSGFLEKCFMNMANGIRAALTPGGGR